MPTTLQSTGTARRWAKHTMAKIRNDRGHNERSLHTKSNNDSERRTLGPSSPLHGPGAVISGTLPRRRRKHLTGASSRDQSNGKGDTTARRLSSSDFQPGPTKMESCPPHGHQTQVQYQNLLMLWIWERPRCHEAPKGAGLANSRATNPSARAE